MKLKNYKKSAGFTIVELIVSISIIAIISAVVFYNSRKFSDNLVVTAAAQEVSLAVREAQTYGVSVKETSVGSGNFNAAYGIVLDTAQPRFTLVFKDSNGNKAYNGGTTCGGGDECVDKIFLRDGAGIKTVCATNASNATSCGSSMHITFIRPSLDATILLLDAAGFPIAGGPWVSGSATVQSPQGVGKNIIVTITGQVSIQ